MPHIRIYTYIALLFSATLSGCATHNSSCVDPYENYNRQVYQFNKGIDTVFVKPIAFLYKRIVPCPVTKGISNVFNNLTSTITIPNDILQGDLFHTCTDTTRFFINTTFGIGGLFDVASWGGLTCHIEDTGLTFAKWGYCQSAYVMLPLLGPCTIRDTLGLPFDYFVFSPYPYISYTRPLVVRASLSGLYVIDRRSQLLDFDNTIQQAAVDPYVFIRDAYLQHRNSLIEANRDRTNNLNIQNENNATALEDNVTDADDLYVPSNSAGPSSNTDADDIYVAADEDKKPAK